MHPILRNTLAVVAGAIAGSAINGGIISISGYLIPPPEGADLTTEAGLKAAMHLFAPKHFLMPFLAHALGTLAGAFVAAKLAVSHHLILALLIGLLFFAGGFAMVLMMSAPAWFNATDLLGAYFPMAWLGYNLAGGKQGNKSESIEV